MARACSTCYGNKMVNGPAGTQVCPMCDGTGEQYDPGRYFTYELGPIVLNGQQTLTAQSVQVLNRSFRWMMATAVFTFPFAAQISDSRDQRPFSNQPVHSANLWGDAKNPMPLLTPFVFNKQANILATVTDLGGGFGTATVTNASTDVVFASGTAFPTGNSWVGQTILLNGVAYSIAAVPGNGHLTLAVAYAAANATVPYNVQNTVRLGFIGVELTDGQS